LNLHQKFASPFAKILYNFQKLRAGLLLLPMKKGLQGKSKLPTFLPINHLKQWRRAAFRTVDAAAQMA
jgi:hypothetical protein